MVPQLRPVVAHSCRRLLRLAAVGIALRAAGEAGLAAATVDVAAAAVGDDAALDAALALGGRAERSRRRRAAGRFAGVEVRIADRVGASRAAAAVGEVVLGAAAEPRHAALVSELRAGDVGAGHALVGVGIALLPRRTVATEEARAAAVAHVAALRAELRAVVLRHLADVGGEVADGAGAAAAALDILAEAGVGDRSAQAGAARDRGDAAAESGVSPPSSSSPPSSVTTPRSGSPPPASMGASNVEWQPAAAKTATNPRANARGLIGSFS